MVSLADFSGIRVWRGFRAQQYEHDCPGFYEKLANIFIPQTVQQMTPLGLQAYYPAVLAAPPSDQRPLPDEIALVVYPSMSQYRQATREVVAGRAYGLLHSTVFNFSEGTLPKSVSSTPLPWPPREQSWDWGGAYHLLDNNVQWHSTKLSLFVARPLPRLLNLLADSVAQWQNDNSCSHDGAAIIALEQDYVLYWELNTPSSQHHSFIPYLSELCESPIICKLANIKVVDPVFSCPAVDFPIEPGDVFDIRLRN